MDDSDGRRALLISIGSHGFFACFVALKLRESERI